MIWWLWLTLFGFTIFLITISLKYENNPFWNIVPIVFATPLFFILGLTQMQLEIPYQLYNGTAIETGVHIYTSPISPWLNYIFMGLGILLFIYLFAMIYDKYIDIKI